MPAKLYGQLVGGPVQALRSGGIGIVPAYCKDSTDQLLARDLVTVGGVNLAAGDQISLGLFKSTAFIECLASQVWADFVTTVTFNAGDATYPAGLQTNLQLLASGAPRTLIAPLLAAQIGAPLWQRLGYPANPAVDIELLLTVTAVGNSAGKVLAWQIVGRNL